MHGAAADPGRRAGPLFRERFSPDRNGGHRPAFGPEPWRGVSLFPVQGRSDRGAGGRPPLGGSAAQRSHAACRRSPRGSPCAGARLCAVARRTPPPIKSGASASMAGPRRSRNERVRTSVIEGIDAACAVIVLLVERAQSKRLISRDPGADAVARTLVALFQGFCCRSSGASRSTSRRRWRWSTACSAVLPRQARARSGRGQARPVPCRDRLAGGLLQACSAQPGRRAGGVLRDPLGPNSTLHQGISLVAQIPPTSLAAIKRYWERGSRSPLRWLIVLTNGFLAGGVIGA